ncbi:MAG: hypothetical protein PSX36_05775 [bacterium]|nr:hypothetical protein [bacterium]
MRNATYIFCILIAGLLLSCTRSDLYARKSKSLDSLNGSVTAMTRELEKIDTSLLKRSITRYTYYKQFVQQNVSDTLSRTEADYLQHFLSAGENLEHVQSNIQQVLLRAQLINSQLQNLATDIRDKSIEETSVGIYSSRERIEAGKITELGYAQQRLFMNAMDEYKNSLKGVELLIQSRNHGDLPVIIKDTISL